MIHSLEGEGKFSVSIGLPDGSEVLLSLYGGRALGQFVAGDARKFLDESGDAKKRFRPRVRRVRALAEYRRRTHMAGFGDRFFLPRFPDLSVYHPLLPLDASTLRLEKKSGSLCLATEFSVASTHYGPVNLRLANFIGFGVQQTMQMMGGQMVGFTLGKWRGVTGMPLKQIRWAIVISILAVCIRATANSLTSLMLAQP